MKCVLEIYGNSYPSVEFSDRHVFGMVASAAAGGINLKSLFERVLGDKNTKDSVLSKSGLDTLFSDFDMATADRNIAHILKTIFPTFDRPLNKIDTAELVLIVSAMVNALVASNAEDSEESAPTKKEAIVSPKIWDANELTAQITEPSTALALVPSNLNQPRPIAAIEPIVWEYPPDDLWVLSKQEEEAIDYTSQISTDEPTKIHCWYQWWRSVNEGEAVTPAVAIELIRDFTDQFTELECDRYYALITAHLAPRQIAA